MTVRWCRSTTLVLAAAIAAACGSQETGTDARLAELEKQLADTQKQLAEAAPQPPATPVEQSPAPAPAAAPAPKPAAKPAAGAPAKPTSPPESQKYATASQAAKTDAEIQRLAEQQRGVNAKQAETNVRLQQQVEELKPREITLPAGTIIPVRTTAELSTAKLSDGSTFDALLERDLVVDDTVVAKAGSRVGGTVVTSDPGGRV
jgi:hypothetical protein